MTGWLESVVGKEDEDLNCDQGKEEQGEINGYSFFALAGDAALG